MKLDKKRKNRRLKIEVITRLKFELKLYLQTKQRKTEQEIRYNFSSNYKRMLYSVDLKLSPQSRDHQQTSCLVLTVYHHFLTDSVPDRKYHQSCNLQIQGPSFCHFSKTNGKSAQVSNCDLIFTSKESKSY